MFISQSSLLAKKDASSDHIAFLNTRGQHNLIYLVVYSNCVRSSNAATSKSTCGIATGTLDHEICFTTISDCTVDDDTLLSNNYWLPAYHTPWHSDAFEETLPNNIVSIESFQKATEYAREQWRWLFWLCWRIRHWLSCSGYVNRVHRSSTKLSTSWL